MNSTRFKDFINVGSRYIPWSYGGTINRNLKEGTVLDIGCGMGWSWSFYVNKARRQKYKSVGVDILPEYLEHCRNHNLYNDVILQDATKINFVDKSFDIVLMLQILSHLDKPKAMRLLTKAERIARKQIIIATEYGIVDLPGRDHISAWTPKELEELGYTVTGHGIKPFVMEGKYAEFFIDVSRASSLLPFTYKHPSHSYQMIGIKNLS